MKYLVLIYVFLSLQPLHAQFGNFVYGGNGHDFIYEIIPSPDGNYYGIGSRTGDLRQIWLVKLEPNGAMIWEKVFTPDDQAYHENGYSIKDLADGSLIITGEKTEDNDHPKRYAIAMKTDGNGNLIWKKVYTNVSALNDAELAGNEIIFTGWFDDTGSGDSGILLYTDGSGTTLKRQVIVVSNQTDIKRIIPAADGNFIIAGRTNSIGVGYAGIFLKKINAQGDELWSASRNTGFNVPFSSFEFLHYAPSLAAMIKNDGSIWIADASGDNLDIGVFTFSDTGSFLGEKSYERSGVEHLPQSIISLPGNKLFIAGKTNTNDGFACVVSENGQIDWRYYYQNSPGYYGILTAIETADYFLLGGHIIEDPFSTSDLDGWVTGIGKDGNLYPYIVRGRVWMDQNSNCMPDLFDIPYPARFITINTPDQPTTLMTDESGYFEFKTYEGVNQFELFNPDTAIWEICQNNLKVFSSNLNTDTLIHFLVRQPDPCAHLEVGLTQPDLVRCDTSCMTATVTNKGNVVSDEILLTVESDLELKLVSASLPYIETGNGIEVQLPAIDILDHAHVQLCYALDCDVQPGATHEVKAIIDPLSCILDYNGPFYTVKTSCTNGMIVFSMVNEGGGGPGAFTYYNMYINEKKVAEHQYLGLAEGAAPREFIFQGDGRTWRLELEQAQGAPGFDDPSATLESCGKLATNLHTIGYRNAFPPNDLDKHISIVQAPNTTRVSNRIAESFVGLGRYNIIWDIHPLEYTARVKNMLDEIVSSVEFEIVVTPNLDVRTFRVVASTYPVVVDLPEENRIKITMSNVYVTKFEDIMVRFTISPKEGVQPDDLENSLFVIEGEAFLNDGEPISLPAGFQNYSLRSLDESDVYYDYPEEILVYGGRTRDFGEYMVTGPGKKVFLGGTSSSYSARASDDIYIIQTDYDGKADWVTAIDLGDQGKNYISGLQALEGGGCIFTSNYWKPGLENYLDNSYVLFGTLDENGEVISQQLIRPGGDQYGAGSYGLLAIKDGNFLIYGAIVKDEVYPFFIKVNPEGEILWSKVDETPGHNLLPYGGLVLEDEGFVLIGMDYPFGQQRLLRKFDNDANQIWSRVILSNTYPRLVKMIESDQGEIILAGSGNWYNEEQEYISGLVLISYSASGSKNWEKNIQIGEWGSLDIEDFRKTTDGFLLSGDILVDTSDHLVDMLLVKLDSEYNVQWFKSFGNANYEIAYQVASPEPDVILLFGNNQDQPIIYDLQALFVKTNGEGITSVPYFIVEEPEFETLIFPNPVHTEAHVLLLPYSQSTVHWVLMDLAGRIIQRGERTPGPPFKIETNELQSGAYFIVFPGTSYPSKQIIIAH